ncbi:hypothetical protein H2199_000041 [Coniosporium tulheliwenetii]|uniref:Uncharacterized protein n=1 Tax=Coniosporium tulheliwenetii TaxID=3383036 RepID=A0ACC2ZNY0_9PEZI|nr:hypothetical protein H2199_000041 [Cladosporium sp. JES 115]
MVNWQPDRMRTLPSFIKNMETKFDRPPPYNKLLDLWYDEIVARNYSRRSLTYGTDKLPAIPGIARAIGGTWTAKYYCGIWDIVFAEAIFFMRKIGTMAAPRPKDQEYRCPSWSWAPMTFPSCAIRPSLGSDHYGQLRAGYVSASAQIWPLRLKRHKPDQYGRTIPTWLVNRADAPVGWCYMDYDEPELLEVTALLCTVCTGNEGYAGLVLLLRKSERFEGAYERAGSGTVGVNAPGTFQMAGIREVAAQWLYAIVRIPPVHVLLV